MSQRPCLDCGKIGAARRCADCESARNRARDAVRGNPAQRGLGAEHRAQVAALIAAAGAIPADCPVCGKKIGPENPITGEHGKPRAHGGTVVTGLRCRSCNSAAGARIRRLP